MSICPEETRKTLLQKVAAKCAQLNVPFNATIELSYRCNLRCSHCYVDIVENDELTFAEWQGVLNQLKAAGTVYLIFTGGEILVRRDFIDIATYARRNGFFIGLLTNATLVTPQIARDIASLKPFALATSLYGATAQTHEAITGVPGSFDRTLAGVKLFVTAGLRPIVQTVMMKSNINELPQIGKLVESLGARNLVSPQISPSKTGAGFPFQHELSVEELRACGWKPNLPASGDPNLPQLCRAGRGNCAISPRGDVFPCVTFPLKLGNLRESSFDSIWRLEPCAELRYLRSMRRTDLHACNECGFRSYCYRCTGMAYAESGHLDSPSPSACRQAQMRWRLTQITEVRACQKSVT